MCRNTEMHLCAIAQQLEKRHCCKDIDELAFRVI
ncbi:hypothetical protein ACZ87_04043, partial [Candidatus Erwinia dacicola]